MSQPSFLALLHSVSALMLESRPSGIVGTKGNNGKTFVINTHNPKKQKSEYRIAERISSPIGHFLGVPAFHNVISTGEPFDLA